MVLIDPEKTETEVIGFIEDLLKELDFVISKKDVWGLRTLAYPIRRKTQARYIIFNLKIRELRHLDELKKELLINEEIMRFNIITRGGE